MGLALARENGGLGVFTLHTFNELLSSDSPTVTYKAHIPTLMMHACAPHRRLELSPSPSYLHQTWFHSAASTVLLFGLKSGNRFSRTSWVLIFEGRVQSHHKLFPGP